MSYHREGRTTLLNIISIKNLKIGSSVRPSFRPIHRNDLEPSIAPHLLVLLTLLCWKNAHLQYNVWL